MAVGVCWGGHYCSAAGGGRFRGIRFITATHPDQSDWGSPRPAARELADGHAGARGFRANSRLSASVSMRGCITRSSPSWPIWRAPFPRRKSWSTMSAARSASAAMPASATTCSPNGARRIRELAACPNVHVKLGGLGMRMFGFTLHAGELPPSSEELAAAWRPYIETCILAFGPERAMFESNFPVDKGSCSYAALWNAFKHIAAGCSAAEKQALFAGTATRFYRLG